jgi:hypothetical protein
MVSLDPIFVVGKCDLHEQLYGMHMKVYQPIFVVGVLRPDGGFETVLGYV